MLSCPVPAHAPELRRRSANQWALLLGFLRFLEWPYFRLPEASRSWNVLVFVNKKTSRVATGTHSNQTETKRSLDAGAIGEPRARTCRLARSTPLIGAVVDFYFHMPLSRCTADPTPHARPIPRAPGACLVPNKSHQSGGTPPGPFLAQHRNGCGYLVKTAILACSTMGRKKYRRGCFGTGQGPLSNI